MKSLELETAHRLDTVGEYFFSKKNREIDELRAAGKDIVSLGIGGPDLPPHKSVVDKLYEEALKSNTHSYQPYKGAAVLRNAFAKWYAKYYGVTLDPVTEVLPLIGSKEGIVHICMTYIGEGDKVLIPNPGYPTYRAAVALASGECAEYKLDEKTGWMPDFEAIERAGLDGVKIMFVNYPHMPSGTRATMELFEKIIAFGRKHGILIVHDNPYSFTRNEKPMSILAVEGAMDVAIELNSLSKSHNMAGWRVGVAVCKAERVDQILRFKSNMDSGIFLPLQAAAAAALELDPKWYEDLSNIYYDRQTAAYGIMDALGCTYSKDQAGLFVWGRLPEGAPNSYEYSDKILSECEVFITPGSIFGSQGDRYMRISLCSPKETIEKALQKIKSCLK